MAAEKDTTTRAQKDAQPHTYTHYIPWGYRTRDYTSKPITMLDQSAVSDLEKNKRLTTSRTWGLQPQIPSNMTSHHKEDDIEVLDHHTSDLEKLNAEC